MAELERMLTQMDLSHLRVQEMNAAQRAELRRRYALFIAHFGDTEPAPAPARAVRKWVPGERASLQRA